MLVKRESGYLHQRYAQAFTTFGTPKYLPGAGAWILQRTVPGGDNIYDAMGLYPMFCCRDWSRLGKELEGLAQDGLVAFSAVTDPFGDYDEAALRHWFQDVVYPYKAHFVIDLKQSPDNFVSSHHRRNARKALKEITVETCEHSLAWLDEWSALYDNLVERHNIRGITTFSHESFAQQLQVPGLTLFRAYRDEATLGMTLWYTHNDVSYYHLGAYSAMGYDLKASFALFWYTINYFAEQGLHWLNLGAGAGAQSNENDGLSRFKHGWSNSTRMAYFCGSILNRQRYNDLLRARNMVETSYFPAYRAGEFG